MIELAAPYTSPTTVSYLPNPQFQDSQALADQIAYDEATDGTPRTYVTRTVFRTLKFSWEDIGPAKLLEIQEFIQEYTGVRIKIIDHQDVVWRAILLPDETTFETRGPSESGGFTLTFLAERISA